MQLRTPHSLNCAYNTDKLACVAVNATVACTTAATKLADKLVSSYFEDERCCYVAVVCRQKGLLQVFERGSCLLAQTLPYPIDTVFFIKSTSSNTPAPPISAAASASSSSACHLVARGYCGRITAYCFDRNSTEPARLVAFNIQIALCAAIHPHAAMQQCVHHFVPLGGSGHGRWRAFNRFSHTSKLKPLSVTQHSSFHSLLQGPKQRQRRRRFAHGDRGCAAFSYQCGERT